MDQHVRDSLGILLHDATRAVRKRFESQAAEMGLSSAQWRLLFALKRLGATTQSRIAQHMEIEPISVSRLVDRAEEAGWVRRDADATDRRIKVVALTPKAVKTFEGIRAIAENIYDEALLGLSVENRALLCEGLARIISNLSEPNCTEATHVR